MFLTSPAMMSLAVHWLKLLAWRICALKQQRKVVQALEVATAQLAYF